MSGGSVCQLSSGTGTNATAHFMTAAAAGANAIQSRDNSPVDAKGSAQFTPGSKLAIGIIVGVVIVAAFWFFKTFVLTGAKIALVK